MNVWVVTGDEGEYDDYHEWTDSIYTTEQAAVERWKELWTDQIIPDTNRKDGFRWKHRHITTYTVEKWSTDDPKAEAEEVDVTAARREITEPLKTRRQQRVERMREQQ